MAVFHLLTSYINAIVVDYADNHIIINSRFRIPINNVRIILGNDIKIVTYNRMIGNKNFYSKAIILKILKNNDNPSLEASKFYRILIEDDILDTSSSTSSTSTSSISNISSSSSSDPDWNYSLDPSGFDEVFFVDQRDGGYGDDDNDGHLPYQAFRTFDPLKEALYESGASNFGVYLARGSEFRESLGEGFDLPSGGYLGNYLFGVKPRIRGDEIIDNGDWVQNSTHPEVWEYHFIPILDGTQTYWSLFGDDARIKRMPFNIDTDTTIADVAGEDGTYYVRNADGLGNEYIIYHHPSGSIDPRFSGVLYEYTTRGVVLLAQTGWTIDGIRAMRSAGKNGSLWCGDNTTIRNCIAEEGVVHNVLVGADSIVEDSWIYKSETPSAGIGAQNMLQGFTNDGRGHSLIFRRLKIFGGYHALADIPVGTHVHTSGNTQPFDSLLIEDCISWRASITYSQVVDTTFRRAICDYGGGLGIGSSLAASGFTAKARFYDCRVYGHRENFLASRCIDGGADELYFGDEAQNIPTGLFIQGGNTASFYIDGTVKQMWRYHTKIHNFVSGNRRGIMDRDATSPLIIEHRKKCIEEQIAVGFNLSHASSLVAGSDDNTFNPGTQDQRVGGVLYSDVAAYTAATSQDTTSLTSDPGTTIDNTGTQEPIVNINQESASAIAEHGPDYDSYTENLDLDFLVEREMDPDDNEWPIANAGSDQEVVDEDVSGTVEVTLDGSGSSDPDGTIVSYSWRDDEENELATGVNPTIELAPGTHIIALEVTDDGGKTGTDTTQIIVHDGLAEQDVEEWETRVTTNSGTAEHQELLINLIRALRVANVWNKLVRLSVFSGADEAAALVPLKIESGGSNDTKIGTPSFVASGASWGWSYAANSDYQDTGFVPDTALASAFDCHCGFLVRGIPGTDPLCELGGVLDSGNGFYIRHLTNPIDRAAAGEDASRYQASNGILQTAHYIHTRTASNAGAFYIDGVNGVASPYTTVSLDVLPGLSAWVGRARGFSNGFAGGRIGAYHFGFGLTQSDAQALSTALDTFEAARAAL